MTHEDDYYSSYSNGYYSSSYYYEDHDDDDAAGVAGLQAALGGAYLLFWIAIALFSICTPFVAACCVIKTYNRDTKVANAIKVNVKKMETKVSNMKSQQPHQAQ